MGSELFTSGLVNSLSKKESLRVQAHLRSLGTVHSELWLELFKAMRSARSKEEDRLIARIKTPALRNALSYHKGKLREVVLGLLALEKKDGNFGVVHSVQLELAKCWAIWNKGFEGVARKRMLRLGEGLDVNLFAIYKLHVFDEYHRMLRSSADPRRFEHQQRNTAARRALLRVVHNIYQYQLVEEQVFDLHLRFKQSSSIGIKKSLDVVFENNILKHPDEALSDSALLSYHNAHMVRSRINANRSEQVMHAEEIVGIWERSPMRMTTRAYAYKQSLINLLYCYYSKEHTKKFKTVYAKAELVDLKSRKERAASAVSLLSAKLYFLLNQQRLDEANELEKQFAEASRLYANHAMHATWLNLEFNIGSLYFLMDKPKKAKKWYRPLTGEKTDTRQDLQGNARVMLMLCDFNRDNDGYIQSLNQQTHRYYKNREEVESMDTVMFSMMNKLINKPPDRESGILRKALKELEAMDRAKPGITGIEEVQFWIRARLERKSVREIFMSTRN